MISEYEIDIYCTSAKITQQYNLTSVVRRINYIAEALCSELKDYSFEYMRDYFAERVLIDVRNEGWDINEIDGVVWFIGIYVRAMLKADLISQFDPMFKAILKTYYDNELIPYSHIH